jgi:hypothetical protein
MVDEVLANGRQIDDVAVREVRSGRVYRERAWCDPQPLTVLENALA